MKDNFLEAYKARRAADEAQAKAKHPKADPLHYACPDCGRLAGRPCRRWAWGRTITTPCAIRRTMAERD